MGAKSLKRQRDAGLKEADSAAPSKRRRQEDVQLAKLYEELSAESDETRLEAAKQIIVSFSPENKPDAQAVEKALNRLVRGLCSARKAARFGYCVTLTELLRLFFGQRDAPIEGLKISIDGLIDLVVEKTKVEGNVPGKDRRDHLIGKLFGYKAIMQSRILTEPDLSLNSWSKVLHHIYELARDIPWLREECGLVIVEAIDSLNGQSKLRDFAQQVIERLVSFNLANTPEGVAIWLTVKAQFEDVLPSDVWSSQDPLAKNERKRLAKVLKEDFRGSSQGGEGEGIKSAAANPNPTFAWDLVLSEILRRDETNNERKEKPEFPQFWLDTVDNNLFASSASHERKSWGFKLFANLVRTIPEEALPVLFSRNLMRSLINQSKKDERFLHLAALAALNAIQGRVQQHPASAMAVFVALTGKTGTIDLDRVTKTKTLEKIMLSTDDETLRKIVRHLQTILLRPDTQDQATADSRRRNIADMLLAIVRNYQGYERSDFNMDGEHDNWLRKILEILVENAYFVPSAAAKTSKVPLPPLSDSSRKVFQERLSSCLTRLLRVQTESKASFATLALDMIRSRATSSKSLEPLFKADESILKTVDKAFKTMDKIKAKVSAKRKNPAAEGFLLLYSLVLLQVYDGDGDAVLLLDDLDSSRKALLKSKKESSSDGQDALVEILLTFLGNPRTLFRNIAQEAFSIFASDLSVEGLRSLTDILDTPENLDGQRELFNQAGDEEEEDLEDGDDDDVEDVEEMSDVEMINAELKNGDQSDAEDSDADSSSSSDDEGSDDDEEEEDSEELARFDEMLANTLKTSNIALGDDALDSDGSDMDDEQMEALDPHLTKIFKERSKITSKKKEREDAKQTVIQFKSRVLDLLAVFMDKQYSSPLTLEVLLPLLRRLRADANKQLTDKSFKILKSYTDARVHHKAPLPKPDDVDAAWTILKEIHEETTMGGGSTVHATACSNASLHMAKILIGLDKANYSQLVDLYADTQKKWFADKKSTVQPTLFTQFLNWSLNAHKQGK